MLLVCLAVYPMPALAHIESGTLDGAVKCLAANQSRTDEQLAKMGESLVGLERQMAIVIAMLERQGQND